ncbi:beta-galactosidase GalB [Fibrella forsythiae]|uniref:Glycoside hydrolase family 2 protein n=1 Tax=Fibrella forsythiae TaxID=2817061 RepID=A0ABS3JD36_9BACT|nr:beta-galactosidase GalB [Fibrella forsythiae]MBO0947918.1 glycoside hydrolase family 2 protein [Fibrella forsythiae]
MKKLFLCWLWLGTLSTAVLAQNGPRTVLDFNDGWRFLPGDDANAKNPAFPDDTWRTLTLPHDWSIEGQFSEHNLSTTQAGALPTGIGWYRKTFVVPASSKGKNVYIEFDGVYRNSQVWINGTYLGSRPYGYSSFRYDLSKHLKAGAGKNTIAVRVDNAAQPNSRWYTGSGIYRNVRLVITSAIAVDEWGTFVTTPTVSEKMAVLNLKITVRNATGRKDQVVQIGTDVLNAQGTPVASYTLTAVSLRDTLKTVSPQLEIYTPILWSVEQPYLYKIVTRIYRQDRLLDSYETPLGIRSFSFDPAAGFSMNGKPMKILGVCLHHDLGALGAAVNRRAMQRQLELLKSMGCNGIRTAHNPPAPELLTLCDEMGFIVMDEAFDMWKKKKSKQDYGLNWDAWHKADLEAMIRRDRNHPSIFMWSIGNEIREQFDSTGLTIARELAQIVRELDTSRPVTSALTENVPEKNFIYQSGALDLLGFNYKHEAYADLPKVFPNQAFIASETGSSLQTRGHYDMPSDSVRLWGKGGPANFTDGNPDWTASAYDNEAAYWGSTHEQTWKVIKKLPHMAGMYVWTGFDYLGEPHPYPWPARSSYFGILDLAGFPKDVYYMYQSEWTDKPVLHLFPHWNWPPKKVVDVWAYYSQADEVELFLNNKSLGVRRKTGNDLHVMWRVPYEPGTLTAISRQAGKTSLTRTITTAGKPAKIQLIADRATLAADGKDLSFITVNVLDEQGNLVPGANHLITFTVRGEGTLAGVDNGYQASLEPFKATYRKAYNGKCLAIIKTTGKPGVITINATSEGLQAATVEVVSR